ncbi:fasciclin domain-containing protein [Albimonas pacifica]|uniref:Uncaracterized surface protein containing fasciclin (FAS1) repeats n=1 Tax=Albimonas pacifica TaxID=1114924 RepID=A0A1I3LUB0_9RHOB|nr:fasciclin domain-containing protein [Albimonas pacifica]SFI88095.1 Uncaracterized surface protein containing fasciclin (FAS1) repeats [Albimonas pacifica]
MFRTLPAARTSLALAAAALAGVAATAAWADSHAAKKTIVEIAQENGNFTTLVAAVQEAGLVETLSGEGPFTVFAPTDAAFEALPEGVLEDLLADPEALTAVLTYHVIPAAVMSSDLSDGMTATTVSGDDVTIAIEGDAVRVNGATVTMADIEASNGVIHVIDTVIVPAS